VISWISEFEIFNSYAIKKHVMHHADKFDGDRSLLCRGVRIFFAFFSSEM